MRTRPPSREALLAFARRARLALRDPPPPRVAAGPGQESVWDFPRPPRVEQEARRVRVLLAGRTIADSTRALRIVETAGAPCYYLPPADCEPGAIATGQEWTVCEWKGVAFACEVRAGEARVEGGAWTYPDPLTDLGMGYERVAGHFAFYASRMDACFLGDEQVRPQPGGFYGGWVDARLVGPIKGEPGSGNW
jgi:uncharacterized protein (DUF427 family)